MTYFIEHDGERFEFGTINAAADYFRGCFVSEDAPEPPVRLIDSDGKTVLAIYDPDGLNAGRAALEQGA